MRSNHVVALVMAAGYSRRFGEADKRCATLADGRSLLSAAVANTEQAFTLLRVAVRDEDDATRLGLTAKTPLIRLHQASLGLGASLAEAIAALSQDATLSEVEAVAILLGDMPWIQQDTLLALQRLATDNTIIRPSYQGQPGHPVIFGRAMWPALELLSSTTGAKEVIRHNAAHYREYPVQDVGTLSDIDVPAHLASPTQAPPGGA